MSRWSLIFMFAAAACNGKGGGDDTSGTEDDADGDGYPAEEDCDDADPEVNPGATEACDGADNDCDGLIDEAGATGAETWYADSDGDSYGDEGSSTAACDAPDGYVADATDCDDSNAGVNPAANETCNDIDDDCDGETDEPDAVDAETWYADADADGYGDPDATEVACAAPDGYTSDDTDCDDMSDSTFPGAAPNDDGAACMRDADGDDWGDDTPPAGVDAGTDCDDDEATSFPGADETCDGADDNCDGEIDEATAVDASTWYADTDADSFGDAAVSTIGCTAPTGYVGDATDCDDASDTTFPGAASLESATDCMDDGDRDGWGDDAPASGSVTAGTDCNDGDGAVYPGADEYCDGYDDDCDGAIDESSAVDALTWYADDDGDTFGDPAESAPACEEPEGFVADATDCDDASADTFPGAAPNDSTTDCMADADGDDWGDDAPVSGATAGSDCDDARAESYPGAGEYCNGEDDNCDGMVDEDSALDASTWYADADGDGYGDADATDVACEEPTGYLADASDCDDTSATTFPGAAPEDSATACMNDADADGYGDDSPGIEVSAGTDCDDGRAETNPGADEYCNGVDDDCDGETDEASALDASAWNQDSDGDTYGNALVSEVGCTAPSGYVADGTDCDDGDDAINPSATEVCYDGADNDCDGTPNECVLTGGIASTADAIFVGEEASDSAGRDAAGVGDVNGDGLDDVVVGAWRADRSGTNAGTAYLFHGPVSGTNDLSTADAFLNGAAGADYAGYSVAAAGDVDSDGFDDMLLGAYGTNVGATDAGSAYLVLGPVTGTLGLGSADAELTGTSKSDYFGVVVRSAGNAVGDSKPDILVGASSSDLGASNAGAVYLFAARTTDAAAASAEAIFTGEAADDTAGRAVAGLGDFDGDGTNDVAMGAHGYDGVVAEGGIAYVFTTIPTGTVSMSTADLYYYGDVANDYAGFAVAGVGDTNDDGYADVVVGAYGYDAGYTNAGGAFLVLGPGGSSGGLASSADAIMYGEYIGDNAGYSLGAPGDTDGDGTDDVLVGAYKTNIEATDDGSAYLVTGPVSGTFMLSSTTAARFHGAVAGDNAGTSARGAGDVDGDGFRDVIMGAENNDDGGTDAGAAYLFYGIGQ